MDGGHIGYFDIIIEKIFVEVLWINLELIFINILFDC